jgi:DNA-binding transcriptional MerR regulator
MTSPLPATEVNQKLYKIGELARATQNTTRTLRFYEEMNLLSPVRNSSGQRLYSESSIARLNFIQELKSGGFSLQEIQTFFSSWDQRETGESASTAAIELIQRKLSEIAELQKRINKLNGELRAMVQYLIECRGCAQKPAPHVCGDCDRHEQKSPDPLLMTILRKD